MADEGELPLPHNGVTSENSWCADGLGLPATDHDYVERKTYAYYLVETPPFGLAVDG